MDSQEPSGISQEEVMYWISENWKPIITGVIVVGLLGLFYVYSTTSAQAREEAAVDDLYKLQLQNSDDLASSTASEWEQIASDNDSTGVAQHASLRGAAGIFATGDYTQAEQAYSQFVSRYSDSPLLPEAYLGIAVSLDAQGKSDDASTKYQEIISRFPQSSVVSRAKMNQARILKDQGETEQAFRIYQELAGQASLNPYTQRSSWNAEAQVALQELLETHPELMQTNTTTAPASDSPSLDLSLPPQP
jgi:TolA-binding protein